MLLLLLLLCGRYNLITAPAKTVLFLKYSLLPAAVKIGYNWLLGRFISVLKCPRVLLLPHQSVLRYNDVEIAVNLK